MYNFSEFRHINVIIFSGILTVRVVLLTYQFPSTTDIKKNIETIQTVVTIVTE